MASKAVKALGWIIPLVIGYILFQLTYSSVVSLHLLCSITTDDDVYIWVGEVELPVDEACCVTCLLAEVHGNGKTEHAGAEVTIEVEIKDFGTVTDFREVTEPEYPWG